MTGLLDPDGAIDYLQAWKGRIDRKAADTRQVSDRLAELRVTAEDDNGLAEVTIDATGVLRRLMAPLVADVTSTRTAWTGASLADSFQGVYQVVNGGTWIEGALAGGAAAVEVAATVLLEA